MTEPQDLPQDENQIIAERRAKLKALRDQGNPFPNDFEREHLAEALSTQYEALPKEELEALNATVAVAGRIMLKRLMGKASFATIQDVSGRLQIYITNDHTGETAH